MTRSRPRCSTPRPRGRPRPAKRIPGSSTRWDATSPSRGRRQTLRNLLRHDSNASAVARAIGHIRGDLRASIAIPELARQVGMSASSFHKHFRTITSTTPLQYQKELRLLEARRLLRSGASSVTAAAFDVGYESLSQFSREYARKFGVPPSQEAGATTGRRREAVRAS